MSETKKYSRSTSNGAGRLFHFKISPDVIKHYPNSYLVLGRTFSYRQTGTRLKSDYYIE